MDTLISILIFFIMFGLLVISHESGHFLIARANNIRVKEFTVGLGPVLLQRVKKGTAYSVRLLPFGGACIYDGMMGLDDEEDEADAAPFFAPRAEVQGEMEEAEGIPFPEAGVFARIATVIGGPLFNVILAYILAVVVTYFVSWSFPVIRGLTENSAAAEAGLQVGDLILKMDSERIHMAQEVTLNSALNKGQDINIVYERDGERHNTVITPKYHEDEGRYYIGFYIGEYQQIRGPATLKYAWYNVEYAIKGTYKSLLMLIKGQLDKDDVSGPVGMVKIVDDTYEETKAYGIGAVTLTMMDLAVLLSVNLGLMNLLPLPALDGGRLIFLFIEVLRGKPIPPEKEGMVHLVGMAALLALMVFVLFNDISKFL